MRKILLVALTAAAMVSCSENEGFENESTMNRIKFGTVVKTGTKTLVATTENFSKFTVSAYKTTDDMGGTVQLNTGFMDDIEVDKSSGEWKYKATFTFDGSSTVGAWSNLAESASGVTYEYTGTPVSVTPTAAEPDAFTAFETSGNALFMLMPQDDLTGVTLEITYTAAPKDKSSEYTWNDTKVVNLTGSWGMGKNIRYTLTLTNNATPIKFTPNVGIWTNEDGTFTGL